MTAQEIEQKIEGMTPEQAKLFLVYIFAVWKSRTELGHNSTLSAFDWALFFHTFGKLEQPAAA